MKRFGPLLRRTLAGMGCALGAALCAQPPAPLAAPAPLRATTPNVLPGSAVNTRLAADRALESGFSEQAAQNYRELLALPGANRAELTRGLVTALLEAGRNTEAEEALLALPEPRDSAWHLRAGLAAAQLKNLAAAQAALTAIRPDELTPADRAWWLFLQGTVADLGGPQNTSAANDYFIKAEEAAALATSTLARSRMQLAGERFRLRTTPAPTPSDLLQLRTRYESLRNSSSPAAIDSALNLAIGLALAGNNRDAVSHLTDVIARLPADQLYWADRFRLVLGLIGDRRRDGEGRAALNQLVARGTVEEKQREGLQLLAQSSLNDPERILFRTELDRLIAAPSPHRILDSLLFYRAQIGLAERNWRSAEESARKLRELYPESRLNVQALGVLTTAAWEQARFSDAAGFASQTRDAIGAAAPGTPAAHLRAELGVLQAEAWYQAGDYRNAALAYANAVREPPPAMKVGDLIFMRVLAEIKSESGDAAKLIDELAAQPAFDLESRWQAEWSLALALRLKGGERAKEAGDRIDRLVERADAVAVAPELRARMRWLQARLSLESGQAARAIAQVDALLAAPEGVEPALWRTIASSALVYRARAEFALGRETVALETLRKLRADYGGADAVAESYIREAEYYSDKEQLDLAQRALTNLTERAEFRNTRYFSHALYLAAKYAESLGSKRDLDEANRRIEDLVKNPPVGGGAELLFLARLKQGDILRKMNEFPRAELVYQDLLKERVSVENLAIARLGLAKVHHAQAADPRHAVTAEGHYTTLVDMLEAPADVRVEAGNALGALLKSQGKLDEAARVWWNFVIYPFLLDEKQVFEAEAKRPYWIARTLLDYGDLRKNQKKYDDARQAYTLIITRRIDAQALGQARDALAQLDAPATK